MKKNVFKVLLLLVLAGAAALAGFWVGRQGRRSAAATVSAPSAVPAVPAVRVWTCSMHPQIRLPEPGRCPLCEMPLIPSENAGGESGEVPSLRLSPRARAMARVATVPVERRVLARSLRAVGRIEYNEASLATVTARVNGFAERLFVELTGIEIKAGDHLLEIYSPELITAQQELLIALQGVSQGLGEALVESSRHKLRRWGLTAEQVQALAEKREIAERVTLLSPIAGTVVEKPIVKNSFFREGDVLYRVANLDVVWAYVEVYEYDLPWIRYGQTVRLTAEALPGRTFEGRVTLVVPVVDMTSRTIRIPIHIDNADHALKPGMFVSAAIESVLQADGQAAPTGVEGQFTCPMHPAVLNPVAGECPHCGMSLVLIPGAPPEPPPAAAPGYACPMGCEGDKVHPVPGNCSVCGMKLTEVKAVSDVAGSGVLAVPVSAVLDSGRRQLVYVEKEEGLFEPREIVPGPRADGYYPVLRGLAEGERVVVRGGFLIDSQFQISGRPSLFYPGGLSGDLSSAETAPASAGHEE